MIDLYAELKAVIEALQGTKVPYALCGGLALMVYRRPRATVDIDLVIPSEAVEPLRAAVAPLRFSPHPRPMRLDPPGIEILRFYKTDPDGPDVLSLDCLLTNHPIVAEAWRSRTEVPFERGTVSVVSARSMIALKRLRSSPQDLLDIDTLQSLEERRPQETGSDA